MSFEYDPPTGLLDTSVYPDVPASPTAARQQFMDLFYQARDQIGNLSKNTVAAMKAANVSVGNYVKTLGYYAAGDGGGASYVIVAAGTGTQDGGSLITLNNGLQAQLIEESYNNVKQFGAKGDNIADDSDAIIANLAWGGRLGNKVYCPQGHYKITKAISLNNKHLTGDGWFRTYFRMDVNGKLSLIGTRNTVEKIDFSPVDGLTQATIGIELNGCSHSIIRECNLSGFSEAVKINASSWSNTFRNVIAFSNDICFSGNGSEINNTAFYDCHATSSRIGCKMLSGDSGFHYKVSFYSCQFELNSDAGMYINANGTYSFHGCYFERNNITYQTGLDKGGLCVSYPSTFGARPTALDVIGCYHIQSTIRLKQSGTNTTTLISNWFKAITDASQYAIEILNAGANANKVLNMNAGYESVTNITNNLDGVYEFNTNNLMGTTAQRPTQKTSGQMYFDTTLTKPVWWDGFNWRDSFGRTPDVIGMNVAVSASATSLVVTFSTNQFTTLYTISVSPFWNTTYWITNKTGAGFTINFGTAPSGASTLDWSIRS